MSAKKDIIPVFVPHIGCKELCVFCNQRKISGSQKPYDRDDILRLLDNTVFEEGREYELAFYGGALRPYLCLSRLSFCMLFGNI